MNTFYKSKYAVLTVIGFSILGIFSFQNCSNNVKFYTKDTSTGDLVYLAQNKSVDCMGAWSSCNVTCGGGQQVYNITQQPLDGGLSCEAQNGTLRSCNNNPCTQQTTQQNPTVIEPSAPPTDNNSVPPQKICTRYITYSCWQVVNQNGEDCHHVYCGPAQPSYSSAFMGSLCTTGTGTSTGIGYLINANSTSTQCVSCDEVYSDGRRYTASDCSNL